jgi:hypothetical protein
MITRNTVEEVIIDGGGRMPELLARQLTDTKECIFETTILDFSLTLLGEPAARLHNSGNTKHGASVTNSFWGRRIFPVVAQAPTIGLGVSVGDIEGTELKMMKCPTNTPGFVCKIEERMDEFVFGAEARATSEKENGQRFVGHG